MWSGSIGIERGGSANMEFVDNTIANNVYGILQNHTSDNTIYNNSFSNNGTQILFAATSSGNVFNFPAPTGGNWFDNFDQPGEGCNNTSPADDLCDSPYLFIGGQDHLPWASEGGWVSSPPTDTTPPVITMLGANPVDVEIGDAYVDAGATALDNAVDDITGDDGDGSGIDSFDPPVVLASDGANQSASGICTDLAGNVGTGTASDIDIDTTAPAAYR